MLMAEYDYEMDIEVHSQDAIGFFGEVYTIAFMEGIPVELSVLL